MVEEKIIIQRKESDGTWTKLVPDGIDGSGGSDGENVSISYYDNTIVSSVESDASVIGIPEYVVGEDLLIVHVNSVFVKAGTDYIVLDNNTIQRTESRTWSENTTFDFLVIKNIAYNYPIDHVTETTEAHQASAIGVNNTGFNKNLNNTIVNMQEVADVVDQLELGTAIENISRAELSLDLNNELDSFLSSGEIAKTDLSTALQQELSNLLRILDSSSTGFNGDPNLASSIDHPLIHSAAQGTRYQDSSGNQWYKKAMPNTWEQFGSGGSTPSTYTDADAISAVTNNYDGDGNGVWDIKISANDIEGGDIDLEKNISISNVDDSILINKDGIAIKDGKLLLEGKNQETLINEFGVNPKFLDYSKNLIWNSSFEVHDKDNKPYYWTIVGSGESNTQSSFHRGKSLRLGAGALARQSWAARIKPWWIKNRTVRVSTYINFERNIEVRVVDIGKWHENAEDINYYLLKDELGNEANVLVFQGNDGWEESRITFTFESSQYTSDSTTNDITAFALEIKNIDTGDVYIDGVMAHVDFTGKWAQLYKDGPRSLSLEEIGEFWTDSGEEETQLSNSANMISYDNSTTGMTANEVQGAIDELFIDVDNGKNLIAAAITDRGVYTSGDETFEEMAAKILLMLKMIQSFSKDNISLEAEETVTDAIIPLVFIPSLTSTNDNIMLENEETVSDVVLVSIT